LALSSIELTFSIISVIILSRYDFLHKSLDIIGKELPLSTICLSYLLFIFNFSAKLEDYVDLISSARICNPICLIFVIWDFKQSSRTRGMTASSTSSSSTRSVFEYILENLRVKDLRALTNLNAAYFTDSFTSSASKARLVKDISL